jgi:hypothetical protein
MANEATVQSSMRIAKGEIDYSSRPTSFQADVSGAKGPVPGAFSAAITGTNLDLSQLTTPALCRIQNLDSTNFVEFGAYDPDTEKFYPIGELLPGESYVLRISRNLGWEYGTGTGTTGAENNVIRFKADTAAVNVLVEAFEA